MVRTAESSHQPESGSSQVEPPTLSRLLEPAVDLGVHQLGEEAGA
jgi:hypothetical protein